MWGRREGGRAVGEVREERREETVYKNGVRKRHGGEEEKGVKKKKKTEKAVSKTHHDLSRKDVCAYFYKLLL